MAFMIMPLMMSAAKRDNATATDTITAAEAFIKIPYTELDLLGESQRRDMIDYMQADSIRKTPNVFMGLSWIEEMTADYMRVHLTDASNLQIKVLNLRKGGVPIVMTIYTVGAENNTVDSTIKFYDNSMNPLQASKFFRLPDPKEFFNINNGSKISYKELEEILPFYTISYTIPSSSDILTARLTITDHLTLEAAEKIKPYLRQQLQWEWNGTIYKQIKQ